MAADVTLLTSTAAGATRSEFSQNVYFICHFICLHHPLPPSTTDLQSTCYWLQERSVIKERAIKKDKKEKKKDNIMVT